MGTETPSRYTLAYPELGTGPVSIEPYISPDYFERERSKIFRRTWLHVGRIEEIPAGGDYIVRQVHVAGTSVLIVRGRDGRIRGFHNVCVHRGNKLVWDEHGSCGLFTCRYHGWTYRSDGGLTGVPEEDMFFDLDKKRLRLAAVATEVWEGFIFVNFSPSPAESLAEHIGELSGLLAGYPFGQLTACFGYRTRLKANWKVLVDSQQEGYHAKTLHRHSLPGFLTNKSNPSQHVVDIRLYRRNRLISYFGNRDIQPSRSALQAYKYGTSVAKFAAAALPPGINQKQDPNWAFDEYVIFPNLQLLLFAGMYITHTMWPISVDESIWEARAYLPPASTLPERFALEYSRVLLRDAWLEDGSTLEATQMGLSSGAISHQFLQDQELLIRHASKVVEDAVNAP